MDASSTGDDDAPVTPQSLALAMADRYDASSHPQDLFDVAEFEQGVALLCADTVPLDQLIDHLLGTNHSLAAMAAETLARRQDGDKALPALWDFVGGASVWTLFFILRALSRHAFEPVVGRLLRLGAEWWPRNPIMVRILNQFVAIRLQAGEAVALDLESAAAASFNPDELDARLACLEDPVASRLRGELQAWRQARLDIAYLRSVGRLWEKDEGGTLIAHDALSRALDTALLAIDAAPPRSLLVVGEAGAGKTALVRALGQRLRQRGWHVFQASAHDIMAGQTYIGELEGRLRELIAQLSVTRRVIWYVPAFHELYYAGRHRYSPVGVLDILLPAIERGELCVVGEVEPHALEKLLQQRPRLRYGVQLLELEPLTANQTQSIAQKYLAADPLASRLHCSPEVVHEAIDLARHYLANRVLPGSAMELLRDTLTHLAGGGTPSGALSREALLATLSRQTGLPVGVLDGRAGLDPAELRAFFRQRVMGQPEAVDCLVDRIAMLKAGLTDTARPVGVFLFAGPTGTGKTEVAKSLAHFLFGSAERMIRLDMSEFQEAGSLTRLIGESGENAESTALTNRVRKQPFSVVLLDEFEKAHPRVWDLFLQVFDDGRLTDAQGNLADFRHSIIILTTNVGATEHQSASLGFTSGGAEFAEQQVVRAIGRTFRPEFVNRIDRVIVFRPLTKPVMREILKKELRAVLQRRGLRNRDWAVEWEESAIDFLLDKGFTQDMGARPLRRAIDRYVLAPLAHTIVERRAPEGDQFLFVRAGSDALEVEFVDPDAQTGASAPSAAQALDVRTIALSPSGTEPERLWLQARLSELMDQLSGDAWLSAKSELLQQMQHAGFWRDPLRHAVLQRIEGMDAIEAAAQSAASLARRLEPRAGRSGAPRNLAGNLAQQIYLLEMALPDAGSGHDVYIGIELSPSGQGNADESGWLRQMTDMYLAWARRRHMRAQLLEDDGGARRVLAVSGLGAARILAGEGGLHVMEHLDRAGNLQRLSVRVRLAAQPATPAPRGPAALAQALQCLDAVAMESRVTRRYRASPSPLVRDLTRGYRSGRLDLVLGGDFDLLQGEDDEHKG